MTDISNEDQVLLEKPHKKTPDQFLIGTEFAEASSKDPQGKISTLIKSINPTRCKPWKFHNRNTAWLTKERCQDLISSIKQNGQLEPIIVRELNNDPNYDYEIICGVRRWFACSQIPNQKVLALVTYANDRSCAVLMHTENASSKDITEFERAFSFAQQIKSRIFKNQSEMASMIGLTQGHISKLIKASEIFDLDWVKDLFQNKLDIPVKYAYELSTLLRKPTLFENIKIEARLIKLENERSKTNPSTLHILKQLICVGKPKFLPVKNSTLMTSGKKSIISYAKNKTGKLSLFIHPEVKDLNPDEIEEICIKVIRDYVSN